MIHPDSYTIEWISQKSKESRNVDKILVEKLIRALSLLEQLRINDLDFIFKGGTALMLLLPEPRRLSIDIDIILPQKHPDINVLFQKIAEQSEFTRYEEQKRQTRSKIEKAHYKYYYQPVTSTRGSEEYVLLDILYEDNPYDTVQEIEITSPFIKPSDKSITVSTPTLEAILGDKLTAFAPNTTGVKYGLGKEMEIIKQLYDIGNLFDVVEDVSVVKNTFEKIASVELGYRDIINKKPDDVLEDIYQTGLCITMRGTDGNGDFRELQKGIRDIIHFIFSETYHLEKAITHASKVVYLSSLIQKGRETIERLQDTSELTALLIEQPFNTKLNKLKKSNPEAFFYWYQAIKNKE